MIKSFRNFVIKQHTNDNINDMGGVKSKLFKHIINNEIKRNRTSKDMTVYHGSPYWPHERKDTTETPTHNILTMTKHLSTSKSEEQASRSTFAGSRTSHEGGGHVFHIQVPRGTHHMDVNKHLIKHHYWNEQEVMFHPGVKLKVEKKPFKSTPSHNTIIHHWKAYMIHDGV